MTRRPDPTSVLVALIGPINALWIDAGTFALAAILLFATTSTIPPPTPSAGPRERYLSQLRGGWDFLRGDAVLVAMVIMVGLTNLIDQAYSTVLVPVWALADGRGAGAIGLCRCDVP